MFRCEICKSVSHNGHLFYSSVAMFLQLLKWCIQDLQDPPPFRQLLHDSLATHKQLACIEKFLPIHMNSLYNTTVPIYISENLVVRQTLSGLQAVLANFPCIHMSIFHLCVQHLCIYLIVNGEVSSCLILLYLVQNDLMTQSQLSTGLCTAVLSGQCSQNLIWVQLYGSTLFPLTLPIFYSCLQIEHYTP